MFKKMFHKNEHKQENENGAGQQIILIAALLVHAAKIDENYTNAEKEIIKKALIDLYKIDLKKSDEILKIAEEKEQKSNHIIEFTKEIKKNSMDFRLKIIEILCKIVYSDGTNDSYESTLIRRVCGLLYISEKDSGKIKLKVKSLIK